MFIRVTCDPLLFSKGFKGCRSSEWPGNLAGLLSGSLDIDDKERSCLFGRTTRPKNTCAQILLGVKDPKSPAVHCENPQESPACHPLAHEPDSRTPPRPPGHSHRHGHIDPGGWQCTPKGGQIGTWEKISIDSVTRWTMTGC